ncbi:hypothetical protein B0A65_22240 [Flavobacterium frigidimaris]|uniref:DUF2931 family protein n=2 Tax=Flavobacterium frigidimaris TaxID=262320 RepID=A0ABX4BJG0_FLAFR|nr:hypothetical protein B0A65_22240 [Flavobacterium frigidimaris]
MKMELLVTKEKFMKIVSSFFLFLSLFTSCQSPQEKAKKEEKFEWNAGISAPKNYIATPFVEYFFQGKGVAGASANVGINPGWGINSGGYTAGEIFKPVPDSVHVKWRCGFDLISYEGGAKLPRKKILELFKKGVLNPFTNKKDEYTMLLAGTAPGGNVTIWMKAGVVVSEVLRFKTKKVSQEGRYDPHTITLWTSTGQEAKDILNYITFHGIPYSVWEKGEKEYDYDIAFSSKDTTNYGYNLHFYAKDGSWFLLDKFNSFVPWGKTKIKTNQIIQTKYKVPVQLDFQWYTNEDNYKNRQWYSGKIILPQNLENLMKTGLYKRFLVSIEKDNHTDCVEGTITLIGKNENKKIMNFKLGRYDYKLEKQLSPEYILPKDFVFPKWEGREPLIIPEIEYWQEK